MSDWDVIMQEAERVAGELRRLAVDLAEAEKVGDYFIGHGYNEEQMKRYLELLATNPPVRSRRSQGHYRNLRDIWQRWRTSLAGVDKARAWGWGVRLAKAEKVGR
ncbi:MAG: hypothetical protein KatS3mg109_0208 [Pirellulaceae bacterium]|nr:MAG: hypothetical protein KatS3mg109_0208 [Pirellulaceae bacterium]